MRCLEKKPADRWQSAEELIPALEAALTPSGGMTPTATQPVPAGATRSRRGLVLIAGAALAVAAVAGWMVLRRPSAAPRIERLAVIPFENRTGQPGHDELGAMVADWISRGLVDARLAEVVPTQVVAAAVALAPELSGEAVATRVARETGATKVVAGAYYTAGDSLRFQAELIDAAGSTLATIATMEPVTLPPAEAMRAIEQVRERTVAALAIRLDPLWGNWAETTQSPPSLEAFRLYVRGSAAFWRDFGEAENLLRQALALDSGYHPPRLMLATVLVNMGRDEEGDSALRVVEAHAGQLGAADNPAWLRAELDGDREAAYRYCATDSLLLGDGISRQQFGFEALKLNRPREALRTFALIKPRSLEMSGVPHHWHLVASAHHMLGDHASELSSIHQGREQFPRSFWLARTETASLAALGKTADLARAVEAARNLPLDGLGGNQGDLLLDMAREFTAHGDSTLGREYAGQAVAWYAARSVSEQNQLRYQQVLGLFLAHRQREAGALLPPTCSAVYERQTRVDIMNFQGQGFPCQGWSGVLAAARGDTASARRHAEAIAVLAVKPRGRQKHQAYWLAAIAAAGGDLDGAVEQLREAFKKGESYGVWLHRDPLFARLHSHPGFQELLRPKG